MESIKPGSQTLLPRRIFVMRNFSKTTHARRVDCHAVDTSYCGLAYDLRIGLCQLNCFVTRVMCGKLREYFVPHCVIEFRSVHPGSHLFDFPICRFLTGSFASAAVSRIFFLQETCLYIYLLMTTAKECIDCRTIPAERPCESGQCHNQQQQGRVEPQ